MRTQIFCQPILITLGLIALNVQPVAFAAGSVEFYQIHSQSLADAELPAEHELTVYLPPDYATSQMAYPVLYLLHGAAWPGGGNNRTFFGDPKYGVVHTNQIADALIEAGQMNPMIIVSPTLEGLLGESRGQAKRPYIDYMLEEIISFVEGNFRTIANRGHQGIAGWSDGGNNTMELIFLRPELFSVVGILGAGFRGGSYLDFDVWTTDYDAARYPFQFWLWYGHNDGNFSIGERLIEGFEERGWDYVFYADDGGHLSIQAPLEVGLEYLSKVLGGSQTDVRPHSKLSTMLGKIKSSE